MGVHVKISVDSAAVDKWLAVFPQQVKKAVGKAMSKESKPMRAAIRAHVSSRMSVLRKGFLNNFRVAVIEKGNALASMRIYSKGRWTGVHNFGVTIGRKMLIPINARVGRKQFKAYVEELMRGGNAYFIKKGGKTILMAENIKEHDRPLAKFKRGYRKAEGIKRLKRGADIPIAVLVTRVTLPKRLDVEGVVESRIPMLRAAIENEIAAVIG
jgi:hypothetical protein